MSTRHILRLACTVIALALTACVGGNGERDRSTLALGEEAVVEHTQIGADGNPTTTTVGITVLAVRQGTQEQLEQGGFSLDPEERSTTPYYADARFENQGAEAIARQLGVSLEDQDGNLITSTTIIDLGGSPFEQCPNTEEGDLAPGDSYESCSLFLVPEGSEPDRVSFLPYDPETETEFVYWAVE